MELQYISLAFSPHNFWIMGDMTRDKHAKSQAKWDLIAEIKKRLEKENPLLDLSAFAST